MNRALADAARLHIEDREPESLFTNLMLAAANICSAPIALVSRQWFKSRIGIEAKETPRQIVLCAHALSQKDIAGMPNALADERLVGDRSVTDAPHAPKRKRRNAFRFYSAPSS
jgi:hypothetical protein